MNMRAKFSLEVGLFMRPSSVKEWLMKQAQQHGLEIDILETGLINKTYIVAIEGERQYVEVMLNRVNELIGDLA